MCDSPLTAANVVAGANHRPRTISALRRVWRYLVVAVGLLGLLPMLGCTSLAEFIHNGFMVGPNYKTPTAPAASDWIDANDVKVRKTTEVFSEWWKVFNDSQMSTLVCRAYNQNLTLRQAGFVILQSRAERAIAAATLFPQQQSITGDKLREATSRQTAGKGVSSGASRYFSQWDLGFNLSWELDFWGRFRRAVEQADANLEASVANYDTVLVSLVGDVASTYVDMCTTVQRIKYVKKNAELQSKVVKSVKLIPNTTTVDHQQALSTLRQTEALIPPLQTTLRQDNNKLCTLLGIPPKDLTTELNLEKIPLAPPEAVVGIPADLLRRRPDVHFAERKAAAQSAVIGIAESAFYPHLFINGNIAWSAAEFRNLFRYTAFNGSIGPSFHWDILNYGRLLNEVRREDAIFKQLVVAYQNTVLSANAEVESALVFFLRSQEQLQILQESVAATQLAVKVLMGQMEAGVIDFNRLALLQQTLVNQQDQLASTSGNVAQGLIQVYRALGGGWELRLTGCDPQGGAAPSEAPTPARLGPPQAEIAPQPRVQPGNQKRANPKEEI